MAKKTFKFAGNIEIAEPKNDLAEVLDNNGNRLLNAVVGKRIVQAGESVQLDEDEGNRILSILGPYNAETIPSNVRVLK